jgi:hypothetical protein
MGLVSVDCQGNVIGFKDAKLINSQRDNAMALLLPDGSRKVLAPDFPDNFRISASVVASDGTAYVSGILSPGTDFFQNEEQVFQIKAGKLVAIAGIVAGQSGASATELGLTQPTSVLPLPDGSLLVVDSGSRFIKRVAQDGKVTTYAGTGKMANSMVEGDGDGGAAVSAPLQASLARLGADGSVYVIDYTGASPIRKIDGAGVITTFCRPSHLSDVPELQPNGTRLSHVSSVTDFVLGPDGAGYAALDVFLQGVGGSDGYYFRHQAKVIHFTASGTIDHDVLAGDVKAVGSESQFALALLPDGRLLVAGDGKLRRFNAGGTAETLIEDPYFTYRYIPAMSGLLTADVRGRVYAARQKLVGAADTEVEVRRFDPADRSFVTVVGPGSPNFGGGTFDETLGGIVGLAFDVGGNLYFADPLHRQIKRVDVNGLSHTR